MIYTGLVRRIRARAVVLVAFIGLMWVLFGWDCLFRLCAPPPGFGIIPRTSRGLGGIITSPFVHSDLGHIVANTIPLAVLGSIILINGISEFLIVVQISMLIGGFGTWLFGAPGTEHIGASGVVLGFFGYLLFRTAFERRISYALITIVVAAYYGTSIIYSLVPEEGISWTGHAFGFLGGFAAARFRYRHRPREISNEELMAVIDFGQHKR
jgi:membrane associated rhomboid family serine protease